MDFAVELSRDYDRGVMSESGSRAARVFSRVMRTTLSRSARTPVECHRQNAHSAVLEEEYFEKVIVEHVA